MSRDHWQFCLLLLCLGVLIFGMPVLIQFLAALGRR